VSDLSIIFDLDGTLLDTLPSLASTCNAVLQDLGLSGHPHESYRTFIGDGLAVLIQRILPKGSPGTLIEKGILEFEKKYAHTWKENCYPYPGINDMLTALKNSNVKLGVLSNKPNQFTVQFIDEFFPIATFDIVYGQRTGFPKKPSPDVLLSMIALVNSSPQKSIFVGDSGVDIQTGVNSCTITVGVSWGFRSVEELLQRNADLIINTPQELVDYVLYTP